jgi:hypothetical protein
MALATPTTNSASTSTPPRDRREWTYDHALAAATANFPGGFDKGHADSVYAYVVLADHLQDGKPWIGAGFDVNGQLTPKAKSDLTRLLTPNPEMYTCLTERVDGACANEASITVGAKEPAGAADEKGVRGLSDEQKRAVDEWERDLSAWWTTEGLWGGSNIRNPTGVKGMVAQGSMSKSGQACLRFFFNPASRTQEVAIKNESGEVVGTEQRIPRQPDRAAALRHIRVVAPPPNTCAVYIDPDTHEKTGVFLFDDSQNRKCAETWFNEGGITVLRLLTEGADTAETRYPWGGWIPVVSADVGCILTPAVVRIQAALDLDATSLTRLIQAHGYGQRTESNAQEDGEWKTTPPPGIDLPTTQVVDNVTYYLWPADANLGPEVIRKLNGFPYQTGVNADGAPVFGFTTPEVSYHEPSQVANIIEGADAHTMMMRYACRQGHRRSGLTGSTAEASGEAYEQARAGFFNDIRGVAEAVDGALAAGLTWVTIAADWLAGSEAPDFADNYAVQVQSHPSAGSPSVAAQTATLAAVQGELLDAEEGTARLGVQDVAATRARIAQERTLATQERRWTMFEGAAGSGVDRKWFLMNEMGYTAEQADAALRTDGPPNLTQ